MANGGVAMLHMDYCRPETAQTHGDDRLRLAGTKGAANDPAATGVTVMSAARKREVIRELRRANRYLSTFFSTPSTPGPPSWPLNLPVESCYHRRAGGRRKWMAGACLRNRG
jgi:hypothetical protein